MAFFIFIGSLIFIIYSVLGYPVLLIVLSCFFKRKVDRDKIFPDVTMVIPVHNEEKSIAAKIRNCIDVDYPEEKLKIIVVSDASSDETKNIVKSFESDRILFLELPFRGGKVMAQNYAVQFCESSVIIFTDVAIMTNPDCVQLIVENFNDRHIGAVSCRDAIIDSKDKINGEKSYIQYDMLVRKHTSKMGTLIGVTGGFYAVRSKIAKGGWNPSFPPDFYVALRCIKSGFRVVEDSRVKAYYTTTPKGSDELTRKVRTINRGMQAMFSLPNIVLLNPLKYGFVSLELLSHKLARWLSPIFLILMFSSNLFIFQLSFFLKIFLIVQLVFYGIGVYAFFQKKIKINSFLKIPLFFAIANISILIALFEFLIGKKYVMWQPTKR